MRVVHRVTTSDSEWQRVTTSGTTSDNECITSDNECITSDNECITSDNEWYNEWQRVVQRVTKNDSELQRVTARDKE